MEDNGCTGSFVPFFVVIGFKVFVYAGDKVLVVRVGFSG